jgi:hypothetical protein
MNNFIEGVGSIKFGGLSDDYDLDIGHWNLDLGSSTLDI